MKNKEIWSELFKENGNGWWFGWTSKNSPIEFLKPILKKREEAYLKKRQQEAKLQKAG